MAPPEGRRQAIAPNGPESVCSLPGQHGLSPDGPGRNHQEDDRGGALRAFAADRSTLQDVNPVAGHQRRFFGRGDRGAITLLPANVPPRPPGMRDFPYAAGTAPVQANA